MVLHVSEGPGIYANTTKTIRLQAKGPDPLRSRTGISLGGYSYSGGALRSGAEVVEYTKVKLLSNGTRQVSIKVPSASAALVRLAKGIATATTGVMS